MKHLLTWSSITVLVFFSVLGDIVLSRAMKQVGDVHELWDRAGLWSVVRRMLGNANFVIGIVAMTGGFFAMLFALSWADVSLVAPAAASLTFLGNAVAAKIFLKEKVDRRRWIAAALVAAGVALIAG
jgi:drug/metabolite transporter (DMT)-like permease